MPDYAHRETDKVIAQLEKRFAKEYAQAEKELQAKLDDYLRRFEKKDKRWREWVADGTKTAQEYKQWKTGQVMMGKRWEELRSTMAEELHNANNTARAYVEGRKPEIYILNHDYTTYDIERQSGVDTSYILFSKDTTNRIIAEQPKILPDPGKKMRARLAAGKDIAWQEGQIQSVTTQAILQGESIPSMARRIARTMGETNHKSTIRYCRTAITGAENEGRLHAMARAESMGIPLKKCWMATIDSRTREAHRYLDGQTQEYDKPFKSMLGDIMCPGDPNAAGANIWNCRCTMITQVEGYETDVSSWRPEEYRDDESYNLWRKTKPVSRDILHQEQVGEAIRQQYIAEYRRR